MDKRILKKILMARETPFPKHQIYVTVKDLAERYETTSETIRRWELNEILPYPVMSEMVRSRWDIEEIKGFEDELKVKNFEYLKEHCKLPFRDSVETRHRFFGGHDPVS